MMDGGQIILDINETKKKQLTIDDLLNEFQRIHDEKLASDRTALA